MLQAFSVFRRVSEKLCITPKDVDCESRDYLPILLFTASSLGAGCTTLAHRLRAVAEDEFVLQHVSFALRSRSLNRRHSLLAGLLMLGATNAQSLPGPSDPPAEGILPPVASLPVRPTKAPAVRDFGRIPLSFERNEGQTDSHVSFLTHSGDSTLFLTPSEAVFSMAVHPVQKEKHGLLKGRHALGAAEKIARAALRMQMVGADPKASVLQQQPLAGQVNYFIGNDSKKWHSGVPTFGRVGFHGVYPGVDLVYYGNQRHLEYDFIVAPHADPKKIKLHFTGAQRVRVTTAGELVVRAQGRELKWQKPTVYQQDAAGKHTVPARFQLKTLPNGQTSVSFALAHYDTARPLVIDPVLNYSTYLGGSAILGRGDYTTGIAVDNAGAAYVTGNAFSFDFPIAGDPIYTNPSNAAVAVNENNTSGAVAFVTKITPAGDNIAYSTFLGGGTRDSGEAIGVDGAGNAYIAGETSSADFPVTLGAFQIVKKSTSGIDTVFVTAINSTGTKLLYSTYLGGRKFDSAFGIAVDFNGNAFVTGDTQSLNFPTKAAFQGSLFASQGQTAFVTKFDPGGNAVYSTYLGGDYLETASGIAIDGAGSAYITGTTNSPNYPTTKGAFQKTVPQTSRSVSSAYVAKLNPAGSNLVYATYLGGTTGSGDIGYAIAVDGAGSAYVTGATTAFDFPTTPGAFQRTDRGTVSNTGFVTKLNPAGTALVYSTYLGGSQSPQAADGDIGYGIAVDGVGNAYVTGETTNIDFPTTVASFQRAGTLYGSAAFLTKLNASGTALIYSTFLSGAGQDPNQAGEIARGVAVDNRGGVYVTGSSTSPDFPVTGNAFQQSNFSSIGGANSFVTKLSAVPLFPDFNNDGFTDLLLQNSTTGAISSWFMKGPQRVGNAAFSLTPPIDYALVGAGDFSGNGATTLVLQSIITNRIALWYTSGVNNATITGGSFVDTTPAFGWKVVGVGDFNGDGKSDLVFQNQTTYQIVIWFMDGAKYTGGVLLPLSPPAGWQVAGVGDFNADGFPDLVFQNQTTGQLALWYMKGPVFAGGMIVTAMPSPGFMVAGVGDYNRDGSADLLFQNQTTHQAAVWFTAGGAYIGGSLLSSTPPPGWQIVGPR